MTRLKNKLLQNFDGMGDDERGFSTKTASLLKRLW